MMVLSYIIAFIVSIFVLVLVHECGHFLMARFFGVKVERFSIGFGKPLYTWKKGKSGTKYILAPILFGGYVKLLDTREMVVHEKDFSFAFDKRPLLQRFLIIVAGPCANLIFALFAFWLMFIIGFKAPKPIIGKVISGSIASYAHVTPREEIVKIDRRETRDWTEVAVALLSRVGDSGNLVITTQHTPFSQAKTYNLNLTHWSLDAYEPDPLKAIGMTRYMPQSPAVINAISKKSPAEKAGLLRGDQIISVEGKSVADWEDFIDKVKQYPAKQIKLNIVRDKKNVTLDLMTGWKFADGWKKIGFLGVSPILISWPEHTVRESKFAPYPALLAALRQMYLFIDLNKVVLGKIITGKISFKVLGGPVSIFAASGQALAQGIVIFLGFLGMISLTIALINLLPLPALDGGYCLLFLIEAITGRPISMRAQVLLFRIGIAFFLMLILQATLNDLMRIF